MKNFITTVAAFVAATTTYTAQAQSEWQPDEDVTQYLEWGAYDGTSKGDDVWVTEGLASGGFNYDGTNHEWEFFNEPAGATIYQIFNLPAGYYQFNVQAFYRGDNWQTLYWNGDETSGSEFFVSSGDYDGDGNFVVTRENFTPIVNIASSEVTGGRLYEEYNADGGLNWPSDMEYTPAGKDVSYYTPNSMTGARYYFDAGYYNDGNVIKFIQTEDGPVKLGIRKNKNTVGNDWCLWTNFTATYLGEAGEAVKMELAREKFETVRMKAESLEDFYADYPALQALYQDAKDEYVEKADNAETVEEIEAATEGIEQIIETYKTYKKDAESLKNVIGLSEQLAEATDYPGKPGFETAIADAKKVCNDGEPEITVVKEPTDYAKAVNTLGSARADYVMSIGPSATGAYDFTNVVAYPWFCDYKYNPTYNKDTKTWEYADEVINGTDDLQGWGNIGEGNMADERDDNGTNVKMFNVAKNVTIGTDAEATLRWYQTGTADWNRYVPYWNMKLTSAKHWATPSNDRHIVAQNVVGLPDGYYTLTGMGITWSNEWGGSNADVKMGIFVNNGEKTIDSQETVKKSGWWGVQGNQSEWSTFTIGMFEVKDGKANLGFFNNGFGAFTGLQLTYYGSTPNFTAMISEQVEEVKARIPEELILAGDQTAVNAILDEIPAEIVGFDAYEAALASLSSAKSYIQTATDYINNNDVTAKASELQAKYEAESPEALALDPVIVASMEIFNGENTTYKDIQNFSADIDAYQHYLNTEANLAQEIGTAEMKAKIAEQLGALNSEMADAEKLQGYEQELAAIRTNKILSDLNIDKASESNPVDITALLTNPSFTNKNTGWDGDITVDEKLQSAERYNTNFDISQTLHALPAGAYEVHVKAFYRDGGIANAFKHIYEADDAENVYAPNVKFYANANTSDIVSICNMDAQFTDRSFTSFVYKQEELEEGVYKDLYERCEETSSINEETGETEYKVTSWQETLLDDGTVNETEANDAWIYDAWNIDGENRYFYPNSMRGATARFQNDGGAYTNTVQTMVGEDGILKIGLKKDTTIGDDWCMFDDFKLFYLGKDIPSAINGTTGNNAQVQQIFTADGRQTKSMQKGLNIVKMSDGTVRKVMVK